MAVHHSRQAKANALVPTLCVGMHPGRSASSVLDDRDVSIGDAERPICIPTQSVGTRVHESLP
ncbi:hypothetical protein MHK_006403 [Candidatus Magnetomorum sp. HK-1]|nr:hypothetical protein MHK_006403 [Candidatus Magnetomorum sp. HK-1]